MLKKESVKLLEKQRNIGFLLEPEAKKLFKDHGMDIPGFVLADSLKTAKAFFKDTSSPLVAKAVSRKILHKTEYNAVVTGIKTPDVLESEFNRLKGLDGCESVLIEEMIKGVEIIIGAKNDYQFGPVVVLGIGGTSVEIYNDTAIRLAPLEQGDVVSMVESLVARDIIKGFRGKIGVNMEVLVSTITVFSQLITDMEPFFESIDLNPVICTKDRCVIADARVMLRPVS
ncbi:MAG: acetyl-CoA synthetase [Desulfobacteraceae bacterium]|nr:acetyl-CoA synthetase [Desulfobacteraceae bacterium]